MTFGGVALPVTQHASAGDGGEPEDKRQRRAEGQALAFARHQLTVTVRGNKTTEPGHYEMKTIYVKHGNEEYRVYPERDR